VSIVFTSWSDPAASFCPNSLADATYAPLSIADDFPGVRFVA
jgi:hypothetical protein